jgi:hypothetical protein
MGVRRWGLKVTSTLPSCPVCMCVCVRARARVSERRWGLQVTSTLLSCPVCVCVTRIYMYTGMWDRTITVSSAGKTFSVTGWQVGWAIGPANLIRDMQTLLPYVQFCAATPMQESLVRCLKRADQVKVRREHILVVRRHILVVREHILAR